MRVVSRSSYELALLLDLIVPQPEVFGGSFVKVREQQIRITAIGPKAVEEHHQRIDMARVRVNIVNLDALVATRAPALELLGVSNENQAIIATRQNLPRRPLAVVSGLRIAGDKQQAVTRGCRDFVAVNEQHTTVLTLECH